MKTPTEKTITLKVFPNNFPKIIRRWLQDKEGISPEQQDLIFAGLKLEDDRTLADQHIENESTIQLVLTTQRCMYHSVGGRIDFDWITVPTGEAVTNIFALELNSMDHPENIPFAELQDLLVQRRIALSQLFNQIKMYNVDPALPNLKNILSSNDTNNEDKSDNDDEDDS